MEISDYAKYIVVATGYIASPGPAVFLAINGGAMLGIKNTSLILLGNTIGLSIFAFVSALGLGELIFNYPKLTAIVQLGGACYFVYMGIKMMRADGAEPPTDSHVSLVKQRNWLHKINRGLIVALTNPKPIIFFTSIYPQFALATGRQAQNFFLLGATFVLLSFVLLNIYSVISNRTVGKFLTPDRQRLFNLVFGAIFILLAVFIIMPQVGF